MCRIIVQPKSDGLLAAQEMWEEWRQNPDGAGYMFARGGELCVRKPYWRLKHLIRDYQRDFREYGEKSAFVLHCRLATHGPKTPENTHPHIVGPGIGMAHNGVFQDVVPEEGESDTRAWARICLAGADPEEIMTPGYAIYLREYIGWNKLVFMNGEGDVSIVNAELGDYVGGRWYSAPRPGKYWTQGRVSDGRGIWAQGEFNWETESRDEEEWGRAHDFCPEDRRRQNGNMWYDRAFLSVKQGNA